MTSALQKARDQYHPKTPSCFSGNLAKIGFNKGENSTALGNVEELSSTFAGTFGQPIIFFSEGGSDVKTSGLKVGVVLSGGPAPGGHNVIIGLFDGLKKLNTNNRLYGFRKGPGGIVDKSFLEITESLTKQYLNTGGFDMIQSGRTKIESPEQFAACLKNCTDMELDALLVIGGDDSNTNAALLAEYFKANGSKIQVCGAPKTIDGDLKNEDIEVSFGFDTACKVYAELVGNIARDALSSAKYYHFIKLMGRSASHIALEVALQTQVNFCLIGEEVEAKGQTLAQIVDELVQVVVDREKMGKNHGVFLVPEGLIEFIPEVGRLISAINDLLAEKAEEFGKMDNIEKQANFLKEMLVSENRALFMSLPEKIQKQLLAERDPHGNVQVSLIETEQLLSEMVARQLRDRKAAGTYSSKFAAQHHFFGYEGRCASPSNFDADYTYSLGMVASCLIAGGVTGYLCSLKDLHKPAEQWVAGGVPLTSMMNMERRHGKNKPVIRKALVELADAPFKTYCTNRSTWAVEDAYIFPGPIQYFGPSEVCDRIPETLRLELED